MIPEKIAQENNAISNTLFSNAQLNITKYLIYIPNIKSTVVNLVY